MFLTALLLAAQPLPADACARQPFGWTCQATWIASLPKQQQRAALLLLKGGLNLDSRDRLIPNIKTKRDACWVMTVRGFGDAMLTMAATKNDDLKSYFGYSSEIARRLVQRQLSAKEAQTLMAARPMPAKMNEQLKQAAADVDRLYKDKLDKAESALIAFAKVAASQKDECKSY